jgi:epoxyqueuosine reductase
MQAKALREYAINECGATSVGIGPPDDLAPRDVEEGRRVKELLSGQSPVYSSGTDIYHPKDFIDDPKAVVVVANNFFFGHEADLPGNPAKTSFMNFYINPEVLDFVVVQTEKVVTYLKNAGYVAESTANAIPVKTMAARTMVGSYGKNAIIQNPKFGSYLGLTVIITNAPLEFDAPSKDFCKKCTKCMDACPTGALTVPYQCDIEKCITFHTVNNKGEIPDLIRENSGTIIAQCEICQDVCPYNKKLTIQDKISRPFDLLYPELAPLVNITADDYEERYGSSFMDFMMTDKKFIQRNAAIALGNLKDPQYIPALVQALETQEEELIRTNAAWALGKIATTEAKTALEKYSESETSPDVRTKIESALAKI